MGLTAPFSPPKVVSGDTSVAPDARHQVFGLFVVHHENQVEDVYHPVWPQETDVQGAVSDVNREVDRGGKKGRGC